LLHVFDLLRVKGTRGKTEIGQLDVTCAVDQKVFRLEVAMDVTELV
jgi:hypothetical protein